MMDISTLAEIFMQLSSTGIELEVLRALVTVDGTNYVFKWYVVLKILTFSL